MRRVPDRRTDYIVTDAVTFRGCRSPHAVSAERMPERELKSATRPTVLFIVGLGRSGSTLLDLLLGEYAGFVSTGELRGLWRYGLLDNWLCGCREPIRSCPFWRSVLVEADLRVDPAWVARTQRHHLRLRPRPLARIWLSLRFGARLPRSLATYGRLMTELYAGVCDVSGARVVVDSSKFPLDALLLAASADVDLFVVHLVRDPRGVANSWLQERDNVADPTGKPSQVLNPLFTGARWLTWNGTIHALVRKRLGRRYMRLRYEEFSRDPAGALASITSMVEGRPRPPSTFLDHAHAQLGPNHTAYGNRSRFVTGEITIRSDERWREEMRPKDKLLATLPALPLLATYGYPVLPPPDGASTGRLSDGAPRATELGRQRATSGEVGAREPRPRPRDQDR
jgi:sulfotransferase family protein